MRLTGKTKENKDLLTVKELAGFLGISRIAVFKKIKKGQIKAVKIGRNFAIPKKELGVISGSVLREKNKKNLEKAVKKTVEEYGKTLRLLGQE